MNELTDWIPAITTTSLMGFSLWLFRSLISTRLTNSVKNEFDSKIEVLRSELAAKEAQIESLRSGAMSGLISRQSKLYERQIIAIDQLWKAMRELEKGKFISIALGGFKYEECSKEAARNPQFREMFNMIGGGFEITELDLSSAQEARPFITPLAWAFYSAYSSVILLAGSKLKMLQVGIEDAEKLFDSEKTQTLLKVVLPSRSEYIDKHGSSVYHYLLDEVENLLLLELTNIQNGVASDKENTLRAKEIIDQVEKVNAELSNSAKA